MGSLDLPDEGFTINRKLAERCSSFTPNPFPDVISQVYISPTPEEWIKSLPRTVYGSTWRDSSLHSTSLQVLIPPSRTWGGDGAPRTTSLRHEMRSNQDPCCSLDSQMIMPR